MESRALAFGEALMSPIVGGRDHACLISGSHFVEFRGRAGSDLWFSHAVV
jgi:hypothetical protein